MFAKTLLTDALRGNTNADDYMQEKNSSPEVGQLLREALRAEERERRMMALDIHDGLLQYVIGALYRLEQGPWALEQPSGDGSSPLSKAPLADERSNAEATPSGEEIGKYTTADLEQLDNARQLLRKAIAEGRRLISGLRPPILEDRGISAALRDLVDERNGLVESTIELEGQVDGARYSALTESVLYRIAQEGLTNACQHSQSARIVVRLAEQGDWIHLEIQDWGIGFDPETVRASAAGLSGIRERARWMGGHCDISTAPGLGTILAVDLPISPTSQRSAVR